MVKGLNRLPVLFLIAIMLLSGCITPPSTQTESSSSADSIPIVYTNDQYGFRFSLPQSWKGYSIVISKWESYEANDKTETGPVISIRDPRWTAKTPRQDIPIMVIPLTTWISLLEGKIAIGAGPIAPSELDQNDKFVFAIPSRYNSSLPSGYEEVEKIIQSFPLKANKLLVHGQTTTIQPNWER